MTFALLIVSFLISAFLSYRLSRPDAFLYILAQPNARSLHTRPTPASGGIAILAALIFSIAFLSMFRSPLQDIQWIWIGGLLVAGISFLDDCCTTPPLYRFIVHFFAAWLLLRYGGFWISVLELPGLAWQWPVFVSISSSLLFVVWMINLYNFMDGMDGFAGGMAVFGFGGFAILGMQANDSLFMSVNLLAVAAAAGFLLFNFPPARIFMGDIGSSMLGFLAAAFALWGSRKGIFSLWVAVLLFSPFIVDATFTLLRRLGHGEKLWVAHKSHCYQRLAGCGWGHRKTVLWEYSLMGSCGVSALAANVLSAYFQWVILTSWVIAYILLIRWIGKFTTS
ncbi:MAG: glycosyltransferase family 4 protein [Gammaproteobacteria bacterium]|nr:glycosyltransferase family 4 protein [Gammaproteobacteria bacterium]